MVQHSYFLFRRPWGMFRRKALFSWYSLSNIFSCVYHHYSLFLSPPYPPTSNPFFSFFAMPRLDPWCVREQCVPFPVTLSCHSEHSEDSEQWNHGIPTCKYWWQCSMTQKKNLLGLPLLWDNPLFLYSSLNTSTLMTRKHTHSSSPHSLSRDATLKMISIFVPQKEPVCVYHSMPFTCKCMVCPKLCHRPRGDGWSRSQQTKGLKCFQRPHCEH